MTARLSLLRRQIAPLPDMCRKAQGAFARLRGDASGNVIVIAAAALFPLLALVGSGIDMGRGYLAQTRLQQACDAGTLAARKRLGTLAAVNGAVPDTVADTGQRFFNINFRNDAYGSRNRQFAMVLEEDLSISGTATADVHTTIMGVFGFDTLEISASCSAQIDMTNTDIMLVLDTTGSMLWTNPGDSETRIQALRKTVKSFHAQMEANKPVGTRIRYGFVPYATNVNVGHLLRPEWLVDSWAYQSRRARPAGSTEERETTEGRYTYVSGGFTDSPQTIQTTCPTDTVTHVIEAEWVDGDGWTNQRILERGIDYTCTQIDTNRFQVTARTFNNHRFIWAFRVTGTETVAVADWRYARTTVNLDFLRTSNTTTMNIGGTAASPQPVAVTYRGCIEERDTYEISDYSNVDLNRALDLDIDRVPNPNNPATQWRPMLHELSFIREVRTNGTGMFTPGVVTSRADFVNAWWWGFSVCPSPARKLAEMDAASVASYVDNLIVNGSTYHDIGMIWGGRLLSPTGLFAAENADTGSTPTTRHLIYLTDGETAPLDVSYASYGIEPLDRRRWRPSSSRTLTQTVESRFSFACEEVKKRNIQVWVISFGSGANPIMENCAGRDRYFVADSAAELEQTFSDIARRMGDLRIIN
ncbi:Tad domain-containing protein [Alteraurantiacibacter palmitatis]|uniref:Tad domain-containing protein n=1 Tax=Alteraurantiacibacter palmitatis TaxID=2054628 RepID=A0ABV7E1R6_9SPHN